MSTTNATRTECFLWPDHVIGKRESRAIREAHNATVNRAAELERQLAAVTAQRDQCAEALRGTLDALIDVAREAGDVDFWNEGGTGYEATTTARAALAAGSPARPTT